MDNVELRNKLAELFAWCDDGKEPDFRHERFADEAIKLVSKHSVDQVQKLHDLIDSKHNLIERIQPHYKGDKTINVNDLQNTICEYREKHKSNHLIN